MSVRNNAMHLDARGLPLSTASPRAAAAFDHLVTGYLTYRADTPDRLNAVLEADPDFALAHCMKGCFANSIADIRLALERVAGRRAIPPERFIGWREAANRAAVGAL